jgi:hypothetical protein
MCARQLLFIAFIFLIINLCHPFSGQDLINRPANSWVAFPFTQMQTVTPTAADFPNIWGATGPSAIMGAWCGGAFDTKRTRLIVWGGGHNDYYGNELYVFNVDSLKWFRITDPTPNPNLGGQTNPDGTPNSRHTYGGLAYIEHADRFFACGGAVAYPPGSCGADKVWTFNFDNLQWTDMRPSGTGPSTGCEDHCAYDPVGKKVYFFGVKSGMHSYDYDQNSWTKHNSDILYAYSSVVDPKRHKLVVVGRGNVYMYDIGNGNYTQQTLQTTGGSAFIEKSHPGLAYDSKIDKIVGWHGGDVYALDMDTKVWTAYNAANAPAPANNGTFGRWRYVSKYNAYVIPNRIGENVYFYKLTAGGSAVDKRQVKGFGDIPDYLAVFNIQGKRIMKVQGLADSPGRFKAMTRQLPAGIYILKGLKHNKEFTKRFVIIQ